MKTIKFIIAVIVAIVALVLLLADINTNTIAFFAIKIASIATIGAAMKTIESTGIIELED